MSVADNTIALLCPPVDLLILNGLEEAQGDGEPDLVVELIDLYLEDAPRRLAVMSEALGNVDGVLLARAAHALKGSSATLGAGQVAETCAELELLAAGFLLPEMAFVFARLPQELETLRNIFLIERQKRSDRMK
jgi:HPt (histidine-containing phosphotransfer) domain-containing protein